MIRDVIETEQTASLKKCLVFYFDFLICTKTSYIPTAVGPYGMCHL